MNDITNIHEISFIQKYIMLIKAKTRDFLKPHVFFPKFNLIELWNKNTPIRYVD